MGVGARFYIYFFYFFYNFKFLIVTLVAKTGLMYGTVFQKSRVRMYQKGHYARVKRPSGPELFEDAARILDELLQKQLNDQLNAHGRPPRYKTHPLATHRPVTSGEVLDERDEFGADDGIERSKTMPSVMRGASKGELSNLKELEALRTKAGGRKRSPGNLSASSADTEGDSSLVSENRKKKSLLRKAKDRFLHAFHRQEREKEIKVRGRDSPQNSPKKQRKQTSSKGGSLDKNGFLDSQSQGSQDKRGEPSSIEGAFDSRCPQAAESETQFDKRRNSKGKALLESLRKSFKARKDGRPNLWQGNFHQYLFNL